MRMSIICAFDLAPRMLSDCLALRIGSANIVITVFVVINVVIQIVNNDHNNNNIIHTTINNTVVVVVIIVNARR